jgi:hypothetical protein
VGEMRTAYKVLVRKRDGQVTIGRHWRRWKDDIKTGP